MSDPGALIVIGGHEDKDGERAILREVASRLGGGRLVLATLASHRPEGYLESYQRAFADLGVSDIVELYVTDRREARSPEKLALLDGAAGVFFSGGDQLRLASQIGDTPLERRVKALHRSGGVLAGTSAGASAMGEVMMVRGAGLETHRIGDLQMAAGLGLLPDMIIDQHFAERGRIGRLLGAVAHNPRMLGVGVDEDTAMVVAGRRFRVVGSGGVYVADAEEVSYVNVAEADRRSALSIHGVRLHVLSAGDSFDLDGRRPAPAG
mgnify:CR=1 FL=1